MGTKRLTFLNAETTKNFFSRLFEEQKKARTRKADTIGGTMEACHFVVFIIIFN